MKLPLCGWSQMLWRLKCCNQTQLSICLCGITLLLQIRVCNSSCCECNSRLLVLCFPMKYLPIPSIQMYSCLPCVFLFVCLCLFSSPFFIFSSFFCLFFCFFSFALFDKEWNLHLQGEENFPGVFFSLLGFRLWKCCDNSWWVRRGKPFPTNSWCLNEDIFENVYLLILFSLHWKTPWLSGNT